MHEILQFSIAVIGAHISLQAPRLDALWSRFSIRSTAALSSESEWRFPARRKVHSKPRSSSFVHGGGPPPLHHHHQERVRCCADELPILSPQPEVVQLVPRLHVANDCTRRSRVWTCPDDHRLKDDVVQSQQFARNAAFLMRCTHRAAPAPPAPPSPTRTQQLPLSSATC